MPAIDQNELIVHVEWNENIHVDENKRRINDLLMNLKDKVVEQTATVGQQDFILNKEQELSSTEAELYFKTDDPSKIGGLQQEIFRLLKERYPMSVVSFSPPETVFEKLFVTGEPDVVAELYARRKNEIQDAGTLRSLENRLEQETGIPPTGIAFENQLNLTIDKEKLLLYRVSYDDVYRTLKTAFKENEVTMLHSFQQYLPIVIAEEEKTVSEVLRTTLIQTQRGSDGNVYDIPLREFVRVSPAEDLKSITAGRDGEYVPYKFYDVKDADKLVSQVKGIVGTGHHPVCLTYPDVFHFSLPI